MSGFNRNVAIDHNSGIVTFLADGRRFQVHGSDVVAVCSWLDYHRVTHSGNKLRNHSLGDSVTAYEIEQEAHREIDSRTAPTD